jgi:hypothetical protein
MDGEWEVKSWNGGERDNRVLPPTMHSIITSYNWIFTSFIDQPHAINYQRIIGDGPEPNQNKTRLIVNLIVIRKMVSDQDGRRSARVNPLKRVR